MKNLFKGQPVKVILFPQYADSKTHQVSSWEEAFRVGNGSCNGSVQVYDASGKVIGQWSESPSGTFTTTEGETFPNHAWENQAAIDHYRRKG